MSDLQTNRWKRFLAEVAAIVVSILLAFWIDAWWETSQDDQDRQILFSTLLAELKIAHKLNPFLVGHASLPQMYIASDQMPG